MKKFLYLSILLLVAVANSGCKKFLEEASQDEIVPGTIQDLNYLMAGEAYPYQVNLDVLLNILSDDVQCNGGQGQQNFALVARAGKAPFSWSKKMFEDVISAGVTAKEIANPWQLFYEQISACNVVLDYIPKVSGTEAEKQHLKGQALAMRSYYYLYLVNMFGKPYSAAGSKPTTDLGVPLKLNMTVSDKLMTRNTVAEVYDQIELDLLEALRLMNMYPHNAGIYKMSPLAVHALLSRMYLYQGKWDEAIAQADAGLAIRNTLAQLSGFAQTPGYFLYNNSLPEDVNRIYDPAMSTEVIFKCKPGTDLTGSGAIFKSSVYPGYGAKLNPPYAPSVALLTSYDRRPTSDNTTYIADIRPRLYFLYSAYLDFATFQFTYLPYNGGQGGAGLRIAELYLNRAEALAQRYIKTGDVTDRTAALNNINTLRSSRYDKRQSYVNIDITDGTALLTFCREERRREFPFEGHRWFDLRRYGMPAMSRTYAEEPGVVETFSLSQNDPRYVLPIPKAALDRNGLLIQNP